MRSYIASNVTKTAVHVDAHKCHQYAFFFSEMAPGWIFVAPLVFAILSAVSTGYIRSVTPGVGSVPSPTAATTDVEATAISETMVSGSSDSPTDSDVNEGDEPPPYQPPTSATDLAAAQATQSPPAKRSSAQRFVIGTVLLICNISCLFFLALTIQSATFCQDWSPLSLWPRIFCWAFFSIPCLWALNGLTCWAMLVRDLWGPGMKKKYPIKEHALVSGLVCIIIFPFVLLWMIFGVGSVKAVEACQRKFCGDALEEESEGVELADDERNDASDRRSEEGVDEDTARLIGGWAK